MLTIYQANCGRNIHSLKKKRRKVVEFQLLL